VQKTIQEGGGDGGVAQDLTPRCDRAVCGDDRRGLGVPLGYDLEQGCGALGLQRKVAQLVDLCGYPHRSTYADTATMPRVSTVGGQPRDDAGLLRRPAATRLGIVTG